MLRYKTKNRVVSRIDSKCFVEACTSKFDLLQLSSAQLLNIKMLMNKDLGAD